MQTATIDYLKGRVVNVAPVTSGDITTMAIITFDTGMTVEGRAVRSIDNYNKEEAAEAAFQDALSILAPGVEFVLNRTS